MFSGIVQGQGTIAQQRERNGVVQVEIQTSLDLTTSNIGDSVAVNGCCLTITSKLGDTFWADLSEETRQVTTLGQLRLGAVVNLELALCYGERVGGHLVQGHVDGIGRIEEIIEHDSSHEFVVSLPIPFVRYVIKRGSIAVNGVSLTAANTWSNFISIFVIPHTLAATNFQHLRIGDAVNLELDMMGKYIEKLTAPEESLSSSDESAQS